MSLLPGGGRCRRTPNPGVSMMRPSAARGATRTGQNARPTIFCKDSYIMLARATKSSAMSEQQNDSQQCQEQHDHQHVETIARNSLLVTHRAQSLDTTSSKI